MVFNWKRFRAAAAAIALAFGLACATEETVVTSADPDEVEEQVDEELTASKVAGDIEKYDGQWAEFTGEVSRVFAPCAFELDGDVLVVCSTVEQSPMTPPGVAEDDEVRVAGNDTQFTRENYEETASVTLSDDVFGERETRPVVLIEEVEILERETEGAAAE